MAIWFGAISPKPQATADAEDHDEEEQTTEELAEDATKKARSATVELQRSILRLATLAEET